MFGAHTPLLQLLLQQSNAPEHIAPLGEHMPLPQIPLLQRLLQHSFGARHLKPSG